LEEENMDEQDLVQGAAKAAIVSIGNAETEESEQSPQEAPQTPRDPVSCQRCGHNVIAEDMPSPVEDEKREYLRCVLGKRPYKKTYTLYDGELTMVFELLSQADSARMSPKLMEINRNEEIDDLTKMTDSINIKLLFYLRQFNDTSYKAPEDLDNCREDFINRFAEFDESVPALLTRVLMEFLRLAEMLPAAGLDKDFWKGAGLT
jgi:hypothetical protein